MSAQTAASRYTCRDCGKTYRSFRPEEEWRASHVVDVCPAQPDLSTAAEADFSAPAATSAPQPEVQVAEAPATAATDARWWQTDLASVAAALLVTLLLFGVALDAVNMLSDAPNAGPRPLTLLLSAAIAGPCVYAVYQLVRSAAALDATDA